LNQLVTIGIPVFNGEKYIIESLNSITDQRYSNIEICIVDDASTDNSFQLCKKWVEKSRFPVKILKNKSNLGLSATCNIILNQANGKYLQLFDQDDIMIPEKIENDVEQFQQLDEETALIYSKVQLINEKGELINEEYNNRIGFNGIVPTDAFAEMIKKNFIPAPTVLMRTDQVRETGGYDESVVYNDWDMWLKLTKNHKIAYRNIITVHYRLHINSIMADHSNENQINRNELTILMIKKHLGVSKYYDDLVVKKVRELSIYSYFLGSKTAASNLKWSLKNKFDCKIWFYYKLVTFGIKHPSHFNFFR
jgi:alpha-1,3-rhamnosyltransferase